MDPEFVSKFELPAFSRSRMVCFISAQPYFETPFSCVLLIQAERCTLSFRQPAKQVRDLDFGRCWHNSVDPSSSGTSGAQQGPNDRRHVYRTI
jgi:hypothetical protein